MPLLTLCLSKKPDDINLEKLANELINITQRFLRKERQLTKVDISTVKTYFSSNNEDDLSFSLTIYLTEGTNTEDEYRSWLEAANDVMRNICFFDGSVNYISIITLPSTQWGYNGLSQKMRKLGKL
ncbi:hypothetical protein ACPF3O_000831 [Vibrio cholerae]